ncbi:MAG: Ig-like domain-containing protein [Blautia sp.]
MLASLMFWTFRQQAPITWSSSNPAIVTVDADGIVVGKKKGTAVITGLAGGVEYTCKVTVTGGNGNTGNNGSNSNTRFQWK